MLTANSSDYNNNHVCEEFCKDSVKIARGDSRNQMLRIPLGDTKIPVFLSSLLPLVWPWSGKLVAYFTTAASVVSSTRYLTFGTLRLALSKESIPQLLTASW